MAKLLVPEDASALRRNNFDAIRLAMALAVVWSHSFALWLGSEASEPISLLTNGVYNSGNLAVLVFFTVSGFLITLSWLRSSSWKDYLRRRILRIHPGYIVATLICSLIIVPAFSSRAFGTLSLAEAGGLLRNFLLRNYIVESDAFGGHSVNGSLWSIPFEFWCYLGVMALGLTSLLRFRLLLPVLGIAVMAAGAAMDLTGHTLSGELIDRIFWRPHTWFRMLPAFLLGGALYLYRDRVPRNGWLLIALLVTTIAAANLPLADPLRTVITRLLMPFTLTYLIFYAAFSPRIKAHGAARFGDFSYGTYLYAWPIQQMLVVLLKDKVSFAVYVALSLVLSLLAGIASWHMVEKWFLPRARRTGDDQQAKPLEREAAIVSP